MYLYTSNQLEYPYISPYTLQLYTSKYNILSNMQYPSLLVNYSSQLQYPYTVYQYTSSQLEYHYMLVYYSSSQLLQRFPIYLYTCILVYEYPQILVASQSIPIYIREYQQLVTSQSIPIYPSTEYVRLSGLAIVYVCPRFKLPQTNFGGFFCSRRFPRCSQDPAAAAPVNRGCRQGGVIFEE